MVGCPRKSQKSRKVADARRVSCPRKEQKIKKVADARRVSCPRKKKKSGKVAGAEGELVREKGRNQVKPRAREVNLSAKKEEIKESRGRER